MENWTQIQVNSSMKCSGNINSQQQQEFKIRKRIVAITKGPQLKQTNSTDTLQFVRLHCRHWEQRADQCSVIGRRYYNKRIKRLIGKCVWKFVARGFVDRNQIKSYEEQKKTQQENQFKRSNGTFFVSSITWIEIFGHEWIEEISISVPIMCEYFVIVTIWMHIEHKCIVLVRASKILLRIVSATTTN